MSDAQRAEVTNALIRHYADGRLDEAEYNERLAKATAAKTEADLAPLLHDLPGLSAPPPASPSRSSRSAGLTKVFLVGLVALTIGWAVTAAFTGFFFLRVPWVLAALLVLVVLRRHRSYHRPHGW